MRDLLLGIDLGTSAVKAALFDANGKLQGVSSAGYDVRYIRPGWVEQDPDAWWASTCQALRAVLALTPDAAARVAGIAISAQAPTLLALDEANRPVRPALIWMDRRAEAEVQALNGLIGADEVIRLTGNRADAFFVAAKLRWFRQHEPDLFRQTRKFVQINGYINLLLTGNLSLDSAHAGLLQLREHASGTWSAALCEACGVTPDMFPAILDGAAQVGDVTPSAAAQTGLRPATPVMVGTVDGAAAALEAGLATTGIGVEMTGTSSVLVLCAPAGAVESAFIAMPHALPGLNLLLGAMVASGASLRWFRDEFGALEVAASQAGGADAFDQLTQQAASIGPGSQGTIFLPYMMGERSPIWHTHARGVFFGLTLATSRAAMIRAILEGAAFALCHNCEVAAVAGLPITELRAVGGGTRSPLWNQIKADVLGLPVLLSESAIGAPFGDAVLAGLGAGVISDVSQFLAQATRITARYEPNLANHAVYKQIYPVFRSIYEHLKPDFDHAAMLPYLATSAGAIA